MPASRDQRAQTAERRSKLLQMKVAGANWDQIVRTLKYASKAAACRDYDRAMQATRAVTAENAAQLRELELLRYDRLTTAFFPRAMGGDVKAARVVMDISKERVKLLGLDAMQRTLDNAVDAWVAHLAGVDDPEDPAGGLSADDRAALAAVA